MIEPSSKLLMNSVARFSLRFDYVLAEELIIYNRQRFLLQVQAPLVEELRTFCYTIVLIMSDIQPIIKGAENLATTTPVSIADIISKPIVPESAPKE